MLYLVETNLVSNKPIFFALTKIYGIGNKTAVLLCKKIGLSRNLKAKELSSEQIIEFSKIVDSSNLPLNNALKKLKTLSLKKLINIKSYRGLRRVQGLPVRGQRTRTNAKSART